MEPTHLPQRPQWECESCGADWPCDPAREELAIGTGGGSPLAILMWTHLEDFVRDTMTREFGGAFERFIGWTRWI